MEFHGALAAGFGDFPVIREISMLLGFLMNAIYNLMSAIGIENIGICIIIFTIIIYTALIPITIRQQKWSKMSSIISPELKKIQKKYAGKKDQASMLKQNEETKLLYEQYGTSPTGGCLPMAIQMVILFALYPVVYNIPQYVTKVKNVYEVLVSQIMNVDNFQKIMEGIGKAKPVLMNPKSYDYSKADTLVSVLYKFQNDTWNTLSSKMPDLSDAISQTVHKIDHLNNFLGINIGEQPFNMLLKSIQKGSFVGIILAVIIPILAGLTQFISVKMVPQPGMETMEDNPMGNSMKTMTYTMPLMSVFFGFTLPAGMGIYWATSAVVRTIQQIIVNKYLDRYTVEELIEEHRAKAAKKREKKGTSASILNKYATQSTKNIEPKKSEPKLSESKRDELLKKAQEKNKNAKPGSLASKANMVSKYNSTGKNKGSDSKE